MPNTIQLNSTDNVMVALREISEGESVSEIIAKSTIPQGHKIAFRRIAANEPIVKYGMPIGVASANIDQGEHVHGHNMQTALGQTAFGDWQAPAQPNFNIAKELDPVSVFIRKNERVAIRNEIWIINTVACVNQTATRLAERANRELTTQLTNVDGFYAFPHPYGCSQLGDDLSDTQKILAGLINHPHAGGVLVLGLGCENNRMKSQLESVHQDKMERVVFFNTQEVPDENGVRIRRTQPTCKSAGPGASATSQCESPHPGNEMWGQ